MFISPLLPPANEVWGKVMFSQVYVCPHGGGGSAFGGGGSASGGWADPPPPRTRKAGSTFTGMLFCIKLCWCVAFVDLGFPSSTEFLRERGESIRLTKENRSLHFQHIFCAGKFFIMLYYLTN